MKAKQLLQSGQLNEAVQALNAELREDPTDVQRRTFLFELLCFSGDYDRAEKQLNVIAGGNSQTEMGAVLYHSALHAERLRQQMFRDKDYPGVAENAEVESRSGTLNGQPFDELEDADPRIGPRLELFAAGAYLWIPFEHIVSIEMEAPKRLRDTLWIPALVRTGPAFRGKELGEVLVPAISPLSWQNADDSLRLGRSTEWQKSDSGVPVPVGQKVLMVDGEDFPFLEIRKLDFSQPADPEPLTQDATAR
ncbi:MAG: virulence protein SciE type [Bryobacterales bacterium]|nr:virulence protein SciE type [Bryobacterales bacterium]